MNRQLSRIFFPAGGRRLIRRLTGLVEIESEVDVAYCVQNHVQSVSCFGGRQFSAVRESVVQCSSVYCSNKVKAWYWSYVRAQRPT